MIYQISILHSELINAIKSKQVTFGGNTQLKIYGTLTCKSGKRMKKSNRVFFVDELEAISFGYRPCGHCIREKYQIWKTNTIL
jgi:methylphosphotriester-DNA--protein-cysteine methyltransferase